VTLNPQTTTVDKMLGGQYSYMNGDTLKVIVGHSEQQTYGNIYQTRHGGRQEDEVYIDYGGSEVLVSRTVSFDDQELQWNFHPQAGALSSFSASAQCGHVNFETKLMPTFDTSIDVSSLSFALEIGINSFNSNFTLCEFNFEMQPLKCDISLEAFEIRLPGFDYSTDALEMNTKLTELKTAMAAIKTQVTDVNATQATIGTGIVDLQTAILKMFA
jgi:flagellin-like hook-associated protein FlgL